MKNNVFRTLLTLSLLMLFGFVQAQTVSGTVSEPDGPLAGANILEKGTSNGTTTDFDGNYSITVSEGAILVFSYVGFVSQEISVSGKNVIDVTLQGDSSLLDEVVLVGYGRSVKKEDLTGSVSVLDSKSFDKQPVFQVDQALQGRVSGVQVSQVSGAPGSDARIRIRGGNSITGGNQPLVVVDGLVGVALSSVSPNDIQSINVLKDASATAIYGNLGANGVIIIKTKKGTSGKPTIEFSTFLGVAGDPERIDLLDAATYAEVVNARNIENGSAETFTANQIADLRANGGTNWQDEILRSSLTKDYQLSVRGGSEKSDYFVSTSYLNQEGAVLNSEFERLNLRANLNAKLTDKFSIALNTLVYRENGFNNIESTNQTIDIVRVITTFDPTTPVFDENGAYNHQSTSDTGSIGFNPLMVVNEKMDKSIVDRVQTNLALDYSIIEGLNLNISGGLMRYNGRWLGFQPAFGSGLSSASHEIHNTWLWQNVNRLTYKKQIDKHDLSLDAIFEQRQHQVRQTKASGTDLSTIAVEFDNLASANNQFISSAFGTAALISYMGRAVYNYDSRYLFTGAVRVDKSSVFPINDTGVFPSFALGWNLSNEEFFNLEAMNQLKLRFSWGETGNTRINSNAAFGLLSSSGGDGYLMDGINVMAGVGPSNRLANPDVKWETTTQLNFGFDLGLWTNLITFSGDVYKKNTTDLLLSRTPAAYTGFSSQIVNAGEVENKGFEISINAFPITNEDFSWNFGFNLSANKSEVLELVDGLEEIFIGEAYNTSGNQPVSIVRVGEPIGAFYGYVYEGVDPTNGDAMYADLDGDGLVTGDADRTIIGYSAPDYTFGFNNSLNYKNFDLNIFIQGTMGQDVFNQQRGLTYGYSSNSRHSLNPDILDAWSATNPNGSLPRQTTGWNDVSSFLIEDASFVRLKNISLGYNLPSKAIEKIGLSSSRIYFSGQNLLTITDYSGMDPEVSAPSREAADGSSSSDIDAGVDNGSFPISKIFTFGINFKF